jgi:hypothetical protein
MNPFTKIILPLALLILVTGGIYLYSSKTARPLQKACTMEAMLCPDGSSVGRTGPNCEFTACPTEKSGIRGTVSLGPTCPVERIPPDPRCADKPFQTTLVVTTPDGSKIITKFSSDAEGKFRVKIPPGDYIIRPAPGAPMLPRCGNSGTITVKSDTFTTANISCDTGIR